MDINLNQALDIARTIKAGEAFAPVMVQNAEYFPRTVVKFTSGLSTAIENTELVLPKHDKEVGVRNIDKDQLDYPILVTHARIRFDTTTGATVTAQTARYEDAAPAYWANGEIKIFQDGVLLEIPVSVIANGYAPTSNQDDFYPVVPFLIRPNKAYKISASLAGTAAANQAYRFEFAGIEFVKNTRS